MALPPGTFPSVGGLCVSGRGRGNARDCQPDSCLDQGYKTSPDPLTYQSKENAGTSWSPYCTDISTCVLRITPQKQKCMCRKEKCLWKILFQQMPQFQRKRICPCPPRSPPFSFTSTLLLTTHPQLRTPWTFKCHWSKHYLTEVRKTYPLERQEGAAPQGKGREASAS